MWILVLSSLLSISTKSAYALNASTANEIHGSAPYLTYDGGINKADSLESLLGITLSDGTVITALEDKSSPTNPIELPSAYDTYANIQTIVPLPKSGNNNYPTANITDLLKAPYNYYGDDDGDGYDQSGSVIATASGQVSLKWEVLRPGFSDTNASDAFYDITETVGSEPNTLINACHKPYRLTISASNGELKTMYGQPNKSDFIGGSHSYYIKANGESPAACFAQPNLYFDNASVAPTKITYMFDSSRWDSANNFFKNNYRGSPSKGFIILRAANSGHDPLNNNHNYSNFPTTGSHGLYFYLLLEGITPNAVVSANGKTVRSVEGGTVSLSLSAGNTELWRHKQSNVPNPYGKIEPALKVTLNGPRYNSADKSFSPTTFRIYADSAKQRLLYEFKLERWYIAQPDVLYGNKTTGNGGGIMVDKGLGYQQQAKNYCSGLGNNYHLPNEKEIFFIGDGVIIIGREPHTRSVGYNINNEFRGGIVNEWGCITTSSNICNGYQGSDWNSYMYWTTDVRVEGRNKRRGLMVDAELGFRWAYATTTDSIAAAAVCVTP